MNKTIHQALFDFANEMVVVKKNQKHGAFGGTFYTDVNEILSTIKPVLEKLGMVIIQTPQIDDRGPYLNTRICLKDIPTEFVEANIKLIVDAKSPKAMWSLGGAITYTRRYSIVAMLNLESVDDDFVAGTKDAQSTQKPVIIKTTAKERNIPIVAMLDGLKDAKKYGDYDKATDIFDEAKEKDLMQVMNKYYELFENGKPQEATI